MLLNTRIMKLKVGTTLCAGKYQIVRFINQGGFGCTYEGRHTMLNSRVAIKEFFLKDFCNRDTTTGHVTVGTLSKTEFVEKLRQRFIREAQVLNSIEHPGIVHVTDVFEENGTAYYVMNYIDGETLGELLKRRGPLLEAEAVGYIRQVCEALDYIHSRNHLHLDIKPSNIMVTREGKTVLIDFGTSKQFVENVGGVTTTNFGLTPGFAPLEQCSGDNAQFCPATDIYALGATFHSILTGQTPPDVLKRIGGSILEPLPANISAWVRFAIERSMEISRDNRPQSIREFLSILEPDNLVATSEKTETFEATQEDASYMPGTNDYNNYSDKAEENYYERQEEYEEDEHEAMRKAYYRNRSILVKVIAAILVLLILLLVIFYSTWSHQTHEETWDSETVMMNYDEDTLSYAGNMPTPDFFFNPTTMG